MSLELIRFEDRWWTGLSEFISTHWARRHPVLDRQLFDWQYSGCGPLSDGKAHVHLAIQGGEVVGFIGAIPGLYQLAGPNGPVLEARSAIAMWMVTPRYRNSGIGIHLLLRAQEDDSVIATLGVNKPVEPIYLRLGYQNLGNLTRWVIPLTPDYAGLLSDQRASLRHSARLGKWLRSIPEAQGAAEECHPRELVSELARLWRASSRSKQGKIANGLVRDEEYYQWRYGESPGYQYRVLLAMGGAAVVRVEHADNGSLTSVLRILEVLPAGVGVLFGESIDEGLLPAVLGWARKQGCVAADFQVSGDCYAPTLESGGFRRRSRDHADSMLAEVFRPYRPTASPINVYCRPNHETTDDWCFLKSDGDMDRPNDPVVEKRQGTH